MSIQAIKAQVPANDNDGMVRLDFIIDMLLEKIEHKAQLKKDAKA